MAGLSLACPPGPEDGYSPLGFFGRELGHAQPKAPSTRMALSPSGNASGSRPFSSHPRALMSRGKFGRHVSRGREICSAPPSVTVCLRHHNTASLSPPPAAVCSAGACHGFPSSQKRADKSLGRTTGFAGPHQVRTRWEERGLPMPADSPSTAPRQPAGSPSCVGRLAQPSNRNWLLSGYGAGEQIGAEMPGFKIAFLFSFFFFCFFAIFPPSLALFPG